MPRLRPGAGEIERGQKVKLYGLYDPMSEWTELLNRLEICLCLVFYFYSRSTARLYIPVFALVALMFLV